MSQLGSALISAGTHIHLFIVDAARSITHFSGFLLTWYVWRRMNAWSASAKVGGLLADTISTTRTPRSLQRRRAAESWGGQTVGGSRRTPPARTSLSRLFLRTLAGLLRVAGSTTSTPRAGLLPSAKLLADLRSTKVKKVVFTFKTLYQVYNT